MSNRTAHFTPSNKNLPDARILVVDDDNAFRNLYAAILRFDGYHVEMAADGADALERLATGRFDLVFTDRQMPVLDGERMVLALRSAGSGIPVVMASATFPDLPLPADVAREISAELPKPSRIAEVLAAVSTALRPFPQNLAAAA